MTEEDPKPDAPPAAPPPSEVLSYAPPRTRILQYSSGSELSDEWVDIFRARDYLEANLLVGKLQEEGLDARVDMENIATMGAWAGGSPGGSDVQVRASQAAEARKRIDELEKIRAARYAPNRIPCPHCGHTPILRQFRPTRVAAWVTTGVFFVVGIVSAAGGLPKFLEHVLPLGLLGLALFLFFSPALPRWLCPNCGHRWEQAEPEEIDEDSDDDDDDEENRRDGT